VKVYGAPSVIEDIKPEDIELYINLTDLSDGEQDVNVEVNGPQNITWSLQQEKVKVKISSAS
jgi:YbbR domain-containing protein